MTTRPLAAIERGELQKDHPLSTVLFNQIGSRRALYVAVLLHDIAKGRGGDHSVLGAEIALDLCPRLGLDAAETETVAWLVRHHLLLSATAFKRDLTDPKTIDDFVKFTSKERFPDTHLDLYPASKIFVDVARDDLDAAKSICAYMATDRAKGWYLPDMQDKYDRVTKELCPLIAANDRPGLARLLHAYEAQSIKNLKLEQFWEPTPFPIEQAG